jgi:hypothetical protein
MAQKLSASMPDSLDLDETYTIRFAALDPSSGAPVSGVTISLAQIHAAEVSGAPGDLLSVGAFAYVPGPSS